VILGILLLVSVVGRRSRFPNYASLLSLRKVGVTTRHQETGAPSQFSCCPIPRGNPSRYR
jgi:hypothetical protein